MTFNTSINFFYNDLPIIKIRIGDKDDKYTDNDYLNNKERIALLEIKNKIDLENIRDWDKAKKNSNEYELIHLPSRKLKQESIAAYEPLSRSYFKMWEILHNYGFFTMDQQKTPINIVNIAEGPGGFIEALLNYRYKYYRQTDNINAITLKSVTKEIPGWDKAQNFLRENPNITINYGADGTGNIYKLENIKHFTETIGEKADFVTADGGFDFSSDFNEQEKQSLRIIFCEIVLAITCQNLGGTFICKFFDLYSKTSIKLIYLLKCLYNEVIIDKPVTSRPANSEKYIICKDFLGIDTNYLNKLHIVIKSWEILDPRGDTILDIFSEDDQIPEEFTESILDFGTNHFNLQKINIDKTLDLIHNKPSLSKLNNLIDHQVTKACKWCEKYNVDLNYHSIFLNKMK
jgi:23S rRNA U2552 (ribose-2'-O)-methylase RlmE/FtsJ